MLCEGEGSAVACCIFGAFLLSQLAVAWRWFGVAARVGSIVAATCGAVLLAAGIAELRAPSTLSVLIPICSPGRATAYERLVLTGQTEIPNLQTGRN